ncbi:XRE family transcriptional regulator [Marinomonas sp. IMCC 4694]|uniref:XRE family transcriptional regulator n=1 Tax=Marinomonas sp. IMCC 4694 TaxID=2605432 RepID=UPI0011E6F449|nr:XRE family transcriptional regulator [Marinomonas sp. IMCC 4694]TYL47129.1 Fis family transcriptional regulator [Marinomonas sp. IMCC 4694]
MANTHIGSSFDDFLEEAGVLAETNAVAIKRVIAWEIQQKIESEHLTKTKMAQIMNTSRAALDRLLDPNNTSITLHTLDNAAKALGKTLRLDLI